MSRLFYLLTLLCCLQLLSSTAAASPNPTLSYTVFSDSSCQSAVSSGTVPAPFRNYTVQTGYEATCFPISNWSGGVWATANCYLTANRLTGKIDYSAYLYAYTADVVNCSSPTGNSYAAFVPGQCNSAPDSRGPGSVIVTCNSALSLSLATLSLPLLALLLSTALSLVL